ncbi:MAG: SDR family oxidoreductase [Deltaproteobacteria bacterium]|nr:SDR family oxidoreductase [Deltaproteobacteria bacterium]
MKVASDTWHQVPVLVTGGAGFIGSHLVARLAAEGADVLVLDDFSSGREANLQAAQATGTVQAIRGDIRDFEVCQRACEGRSMVFHQAARGSVPRSLKDPATTIGVNVSGTANIFTAARDAGVRRVVYASSSSVYGDSDTLPKREGEEGQPLSPYALSKVMNEQLAKTFGDSFGLCCIGLRYFNVYGPRQDPAGPYAAVIPRFFQACAKGGQPAVYGDGEQSRDFTFVADAVEANLLAAQGKPEACGRAYNVGAGNRTTVLDLAARISELVGSGGGVEHLPPRTGDVPHSRADLATVEEALGFRPSISLDEGLALTWNSFP